MGKRKGMLILLLTAALALSGCGEQKETASPTAGPDAGPEPGGSVLTQAQGELADSVRALMEP